jgi:hypothetical protein
MVKYFYGTNYSLSMDGYDMHPTLLHAKVTIIADEYDCALLYNLAKTLLEESLQSNGFGSWAPVYSLIDQYTSDEIEAHRKLHDLVISRATRSRVDLKAAMGVDDIMALLLSNSDLATDILKRGVNNDLACLDSGSQFVLKCPGC